MRAEVPAPFASLRFQKTPLEWGFGLSVDILYTPSHLLNGPTNKPYSNNNIVRAAIPMLRRTIVYFILCIRRFVRVPTRYNNKPAGKQIPERKPTNISTGYNYVSMYIFIHNMGRGKSC